MIIANIYIIIPRLLLYQPFLGYQSTFNNLHTLFAHVRPCCLIFFRPTYHIMNNVTKHADGHVTMEPLNDANAIFAYRGLYHVMNQAGGGNWTHVRRRVIVIETLVFSVPYAV